MKIVNPLKDVDIVTSCSISLNNYQDTDYVVWLYCSLPMYEYIPVIHTCYDKYDSQPGKELITADKTDQQFVSIYIYIYIFIIHL